ncbi:MAG: peptidylprolyl isomerase [Cryomorphaceae bacterium]|nr:peptidylprolyl isomerase [Cryomorphaceae bacterium]
MFRIFSCIAALVLTFSTLNVIAQPGSGTVLTVENEKVSRNDFESIFKKNNRDTVVTQASIDEYMELFINFKLKVREAREEGLDTNDAFKRELKGYRKQLARPYLIDNDLLDELVREAYDRSSTEIKATHILIKVDQNARPEDTLKAYNRALKLRERILAGEDFADVARSKGGSDDPSVRDNGGDLGYFSAFQMVYPFESAAFNTPAGEISMPIRTRYGYHIVKTLDRRPARGEIRVAHIMVRSQNSQDPASIAEAESKVREIYQKLQEGSDFSEMAMRFSQDASTAKNGGELPWFGTGKMVEEFENASFALKADGEITEPFKSSYGWHIVKRLEYRPVASYEESEPELRKKVSRDSRAELTKSSFLTKLRKQYGTTVNAKSLKPIYKAADHDSAFVNTNSIKVKKLKKLNKELFSIDGKAYTSRQFYDYLIGTKVRRRDLTGREVVDEQLNEYIDKELIDYEDSKLESKYNDFRLLMNEYNDGILLFELTDRKVWSKAVKDTLGLEAFYEANKQNFMWKERATAATFTCANDDIAKKVAKLLAKGKTPQEVKEELNKDSNLNVTLEEGTWEKGDNSVLDQATWKQGAVSTVADKSQSTIVQVQEVIPATEKKLDEAKGMITAEYQSYLEKEWIKALRSKYNFSVNRDVLYSIK